MSGHIAVSDPRIANIEAIAVRVPFRHPFSLGSGRVGGPQEPGTVLFVRVETTDGRVGWGEQRALPIWSYETIESMHAVVTRHLAPIATGLSPFDVWEFHARADAALSPSVSNGMPFARAALDIAMHDLAGQIAGVPVHALLGGRVTDRLALCSAIGADAPDAMAARVHESRAYPAYKIKVTGDVKLDTERIHAVEAAAAGKPLWLDANQSYAPMRFRQLLERIADVPSVMVAEQPVPSADWAGMAAIRRRSPLPIAIDEGSFTSTDLAKVVLLEAADSVVVKVCKSGGLRKLQQTAAVAQAHGVELLGSGLTDCGVAFAAGVHVLSTLRLALPAELNGPELLDELFVNGLDFGQGDVAVPDRPGLGIDVDEPRIREAAFVV